MSEPVWVEYSPEWAKHVKGRYEERTYDEETKQPNPQRVEMTCTHEGCGQSWKTVCASGLVRRHIANFAQSHLHRDPLQGRQL